FLCSTATPFLRPDLRRSSAPRGGAVIGWPSGHRLTGGSSLTVPSTALRWLVRERRAIGQHPMHDDGEVAGQPHLGFLHPAPPGELHRPALHCRATLEGLDQNDVGGFVKNRARTHASPIFEMRPSMSVSPDWYLVGVRPK